MGSGNLLDIKYVLMVIILCSLVVAEPIEIEERDGEYVSATSLKVGGKSLASITPIELQQDKTYLVKNKGRAFVSNSYNSVTQEPYLLYSNSMAYLDIDTGANLICLDVDNVNLYKIKQSTKINALWFDEKKQSYVNGSSICFNDVGGISNFNYMLVYLGEGVAKYNISIYYSNKKIVLDPYVVGTLSTNNLLSLYLPFDGNISAVWASKLNVFLPNGTRKVQNINYSSVTDSIVNPQYSADSSVSTYSYLDCGVNYFGYMYHNLYKSSSDTGMIIEINHSNGLNNFTVPSSCFNYYSDRVEFQTYLLNGNGLCTADGSVTLYCYDGGYTSIGGYGYPFTDGLKALIYNMGGYLTNQTNFTAYAAVNVSTFHYTNNINSTALFLNNSINELNSSIYLNGSSFINVTNSSLNNGSQDRSVCFFIKPNLELTSVNKTIFSYGTNTSTNGFEIALDDTTGGIYLNNYNINLLKQGSYLANGAWSHLCVIYANGILYLYRNSTLINQTTIQLNTTTSKVLIGRSIGIQPQFYKGFLDEFMFFNYALTNNEIIQLYFGYNYSLSVYFKDEITKEDVSDIINLDILSNNYSNSYTTLNSFLFLNGFDTTGLLNFRYKGDNYQERFYYINITNTTINSNITLYVLSNNYSSNITFTVYDNAGNEVEDVYLQILRYDITDNTYKTVAYGKTDVAGKIYLGLQKYTEFYKIYAYYPFGVLVKQTTPAYINSDSVNLLINTEEVANLGFDTVYGINKNLSFDETSKRFIFTFTNPTNEQITATLYAYKLTPGGKILLNQSTITSSAATILAGVGNIVNDTQYIGDVVVTINGETIDAGKLIHVTDSPNPFNYMGLLIVALMTFVAVGFGISDMRIAIVLVPLPSVAASYLGILPISLAPLFTALEIAAIGLAWYLGDN